MSLNFDLETIMKQKPDFVIAEEAIEHESYSHVFRSMLEEATRRANAGGLLITGYHKSRNKMSGGQEVRLFKWKRVL